MVPTPKILVVDDEAGIRFFLEETLTRDGYQVVTVESGEAAMERMATQEFALALIDLRLTGIGGMEVLSALRQQSPDTAIIVITAHASLETSVEALRLGAHDYLFKPCKTTELRESVRTALLSRQRELRRRELLAFLERSLTNNLEEIRATVVGQSVDLSPGDSGLAGSSSQFLQRDGWAVDLARHVIELDGHVLELSPTEFDLLAYLVRESPRVVSPQELMREVQEYECESWEASDTVRYHIYRIRQKVKSMTGRTDVIRTVRGVGYTISDRRP